MDNIFENYKPPILEKRVKLLQKDISECVYCPLWKKNSECDGRIDNKQTQYCIFLNDIKSYCGIIIHFKQKG